MPTVKFGRFSTAPAESRDTSNSINSIIDEEDLANVAEAASFAKNAQDFRASLDMAMRQKEGADEYMPPSKLERKKAFRFALGRQSSTISEATDAEESVVSGVSTDIFNSLKASTKAIERLKKENAYLKEEKKEIEKRFKKSDKLLEEVRTELEQSAAVCAKSKKEKEELQEQLEQLHVEKEAALEDAEKCDKLLQMAYESLKVARQDKGGRGGRGGMNSDPTNAVLRRERDEARQEKIAADNKIKKCEQLLKEAYKQLEAKAKSKSLGAKLKGLDIQKTQKEVSEKMIEKLKKEKAAAHESAKDAAMQAEIKVVKAEKIAQLTEEKAEKLKKEVAQLKEEKINVLERLQKIEDQYLKLEEKAKNDKKKLLKAQGKLSAEKEVAEKKIEECHDLLREAYTGLKKAKLTQSQKEMLKQQRNRLNEELKEAEAKATKYQTMLEQVFGDMQEKKHGLRVPPTERKKKSQIVSQVPIMRPVTNMPKVDDVIFSIMPQEKPFYFF